MLDNLGTPFLTTKENGTGLGLAVCYRIAARHKATIKVDTGPQGTTFWVTFPGSLEGRGSKGTFFLLPPIDIRILHVYNIIER